MRVSGLELIPVRATERTVWLIVRLSTDAGLTGLGEASDAFGFAKTTKQDARQMEAALNGFFGLVEGVSPRQIESYVRAAAPVAVAGGLVAATAASAIEQALWDLAGQSLGVPTWSLLGVRRRDRLPVYANINRASKPRTPQGFADTARRAVEEGFRAVKAAVFDGYPKQTVEAGIDCMFAIRDAVGPQVAVMVDCHAFFDVPLAQEVARRLEPCNLSWYEEPVLPENTVDTLAIKSGIRQKMAGGELLFGTPGFEPLCKAHAVDLIMPDVKHCGGLLELTRIAAMAQSYGIEVAPHNPSGPVATVASVHVGAVLENFQSLELQWGEVAWRSGLLLPVEHFEGGTIAVPDSPGFGIRLNDKLAAAHRI
jgi:galactonate dehydratase